MGWKRYAMPCAEKCPNLKDGAQISCRCGASSNLAYASAIFVAEPNQRTPPDATRRNSGSKSYGTAPSHALSSAGCTKPPYSSTETPYGGSVTTASIAPVGNCGSKSRQSPCTTEQQACLPIFLPHPFALPLDMATTR